MRFHDPCPRETCPRENGERGKEPTPNPSQEGNCRVSSQDLSSISVGEGKNPCHPVTRIKKMVIVHPLPEPLPPGAGNTHCFLVFLPLDGGGLGGGGLLRINISPQRRKERKEN